MKNNVKPFLLIFILLGMISCKSTPDLSTEKNWIKVELYFGAEVPGPGEDIITGSYDAITDVTDEDFRIFLREIVVPRFKYGFTVIEGIGGWERDGELIVEKSRKLILLVEAKYLEESKTSINEIISAYTTQFNQDAVMQIMYEAKVDFLK